MRWGGLSAIVAVSQMHKGASVDLVVTVNTRRLFLKCLSKRAQGETQWCFKEMEKGGNI